MEAIIMAQSEERDSQDVINRIDQVLFRYGSMRLMDWFGGCSRAGLGYSPELIGPWRSTGKEILVYEMKSRLKNPGLDPVSFTLRALEIPVDSSGTHIMLPVLHLSSSSSVSCSFSCLPKSLSLSSSLLFRQDKSLIPLTFFTARRETSRALFFDTKQGISESNTDCLL
ncbi:hypothetical protein Tco_0717180 [Tanacetum coccineum]